MLDSAPARRGSCGVRGLGALVLALVLAGAAWAPPASGAAADDDNAAAAVRSAQAEYAAAGTHVAEASARVDDLDAERAALVAERDALDAGQRDAAGELEGARDVAQRTAIEAYMTGTGLDLAASSLIPDTSGDGLYRHELLRVNADHTKQVVHDYAEANRNADGRIRELVDALAANAEQSREAANELDAAKQRWQLADARLREADRVAAEVDARGGEIEVLPDGSMRRIGYVGMGSDGGPTPSQSGNAFGVGWDKLRHCESGGNYAAVSPTGAYRGAYQFDVTTWRGMGGDGDPATARPAEQDYRAQLLYNMRGAQPWPVCGRYLLEDPTIHPHPAVPPPPIGTWFPPTWVPPPTAPTLPFLPVPTTKPAPTTTVPVTTAPTTTTTTLPVTTTVPPATTTTTTAVTTTTTSTTAPPVPP